MDMNAVHLSSSLRDELASCYEVGHMEPSEKAARLYALHELYYAMQRIGWVEHTSDWDWMVYVETIDGEWEGDNTYNDHEDTAEDVYCDDFELNFDKDSYPHTSNEDAFSDFTLTLPCWDVNGDTVPGAVINLSNVKSITITER